MGKKDRGAPRLAVATLRDMPGTQVLFWVVEQCPYCGSEHLHVAGNLRTADPGESLGEYPAPCNPARQYVLTPPPKTKRQKSSRKGRRVNWDDEDW